MSWWCWLNGAPRSHTVRARTLISVPDSVTCDGCSMLMLRLALERMCPVVVKLPSWPRCDLPLPCRSI
uniref:Putative secreted peptide n=1 Tax=Anopheles braziliensis TaxID=58242 RepID=A0A2M3ZWG0_9DIPT